MKRLFSAMMAIITTCIIIAQSPEAISYQAVIRNNNNELLINTKVGMQITILQSSVDGTPVYTETQTPTSNSNGLISIEIGNGTTINDFSTIDWSAGPYFIKTETDLEGGTNYTISGTSQVLSVPYALYAKTAESATEIDPVYNASAASDITSNDISSWNNKLESYTEIDPIFSASQAANITTSDIANLGNLSGTNTGDQDLSGLATKDELSDSIDHIRDEILDTISYDFYLGQDTLGGIVYYIYLGSDGQQHGLIVSKTETLAIWQNTNVLVNADRTDDGLYNMNLMSDSPAKDWIKSNFSSDWYLPSTDELNILLQNRYLVNKIMRFGGHQVLSNWLYWSSMEHTASSAYRFDFGEGIIETSAKSSSITVRAIRTF